MRKIHVALVAFALMVVSGYALAQQAPAPAAPVPPHLHSPVPLRRNRPPTMGPCCILKAAASG